MPALTESDGGGRAVKQFLTPPIVILTVVAVTRQVVGPLAASFVYLLLTGVVYLGIYAAAKHWHIPYTTGFIFTGLILFWLVPGAFSDLVHPAFRVAGTLLGIGFFVAMIHLLFKKACLFDLLEKL